jgi:hypothetical protein
VNFALLAFCELRLLGIFGSSPRKFQISLIWRMPGAFGLVTVSASAPLGSVQAKRSKQLMDVAKKLAEKVKDREERGLLPITMVDIQALILYGFKSGQKPPPPAEFKDAVYSRDVGFNASCVLYDYFDGRPADSDDDENYRRNLRLYIDRVVAAHQEQRNKQSIRLLGILYDEWIYNMRFYWSWESDDDFRVQFYRYLRAAQYLGIEDDWPELLPARPEMRPQEPEPQPQYSPSKQQPYASDPNFAARIGQMQNDLNWAMGNPGGWAQGGMRVKPGGGITTNPYDS